MNNRSKELHTMIEEFQRELEELLEKYCKGDVSDTPDFVLAQYLCHCLEAWNVAIEVRKRS